MDILTKNIDTQTCVLDVVEIDKVLERMAK